MSYNIDSFPVGIFQCNCSLIWDSETLNAMVVDPGGDFEIIQERILSHGLNVKILWHTHAHLDHVGATLELANWCAERSGGYLPEIYLHEEDRWLYENIGIQSQTLGLPAFEVPKNFSRIKNLQQYEEFPRLLALHTPGHTPGSCCLNLEGDFEASILKGFRKSSSDDCSGVVFTGDTLFRRSIGRTDLWGGNSSVIEQSIQKKLYNLPARTFVIPGHGPVTTIEEESEDNPFVQKVT